MRYLALVLSVLLVAPTVTYAEVSVSDSQPYVIVIDGYQLQLKTFEENKRVKIPKAGVFFDEFDYSILHGELAKSQSRCDARIEEVKKERDELCKSEKDGIRKRFKEQLKVLETENQDLSRKLEALKTTLKMTVETHESQLKLHYIVGSAAGVTILGLLTIAIIK